MNCGDNFFPWSGIRKHQHIAEKRINEADVHREAETKVKKKKNLHVPDCARGLSSLLYSSFMRNTPFAIIGFSGISPIYHQKSCLIQHSETRFLNRKNK